MPVNGFTVGRDVSVVIRLGGSTKRFSLITGFSARPITNDDKVKGLDGETRHLLFHDGWSGQFDIERQDDDLDAFWAELEEKFHKGIDAGTGSITETIQEADGGQSQYRYTKVVFKLDELGEKRGSGTVKQRLSFTASRRIKVT